MAAETKAVHPVEKYFDTLSKYHYYIFFFLFTSKLPMFWHMVSLIFLSPPMEYTCGGEEKNVCPCEKPDWDTTVFSKTIQTKYALLCERRMLIQTAQSMLYIGTLFGAFTFGMLADKFGRLSMFSVCMTIVSVFGCLVSWMPTIYSFLVIRWVEGVGVGGSIVTGYVLCIEYCGTHQRELVTILYHVPLNFGHMTLAGVSYALRNCDDLQLAISVPVIFFAFMYCLNQESPKWLIDSGQIDKAVKVMDHIAKFNNTSYGNIRAEMEAYRGRSVIPPQREMFWHIFNYKRLVINFFCMAYIYFVCGMGFYGVSQYIGTMSGNIHLNVAISGALLIPATLTCYFFLHYLSRRIFLMITNAISGALMLTVVLIIPPTMAKLRVFTACLGNCFFFMSFIIVFLYGVELFPTSVRNSTLGFLSVVSRIGQIVAPFINFLPPKASGCVFGLCAILGSVLCIPLPETKNVALPSTLKECDNPQTTNAGVSIK